MRTYEEIVQEYRKRQRDTVVDTIATGLTYVDKIAVDTGLLEETGLLAELSGSISGVLPFVVISATEGTKVLLGKKPGKTGLKDGVFRMVKSGTAIGIGSVVTGATGLWAAIPVTMGVRALFDRYRSKALTGHRVQSRIARLKELNQFIRKEHPKEEEEKVVLVEDKDGFSVSGYVE